MTNCAFTSLKSEVKNCENGEKVVEWTGHEAALSALGVKGKAKPMNFE